MEVVFGEPSYRLATPEVEAFVSEVGGQIAPVSFELDHVGTVHPFHIGPWTTDPEFADLPPILRVLRGDFFCMPFGNGEPLHGETANAKWDLVDHSDTSLTLGLDLTQRHGHVEKKIELKVDHRAVYSTHTLSGMIGPMTFGHHAMLRFDEDGLVATSPFVLGEVFPDRFENPEEGGYSSLKQAARFSSLESVPRADGGTADLSRYPAREGFEDLVMVVNEPSRPGFAWTAVTFPHRGYVWFCLKDPAVLASTVLWHSNGGRHYRPWNGRHRRVLGLEEVTSFFHSGLQPSIEPNEISAAGLKTFHQLSPDTPMVIHTVMAVAQVPNGFDHVAEIRPSGDGVDLTSKSGQTAHALLDLSGLPL